MPKLLKILHVEDDFDYSDMFQLQMNRIAKKKDCEKILFDIVASVEEAIQKIDKNSYDCIVCDYQIIGGNGLDVLKGARKRNAFVPLIFLTGQGDEQVAREAFVHGANDYFTKDIGFVGYDRIYNSILRHVEFFETSMQKEEAENKYKTIFETASTAGAMLEEDTTISLVNSKFEELSGCAKEEIEGKKKWTEFVTKDDLKKMVKYHHDRRVNGKSAPSEYEFQFVAKDGSVRDIFLSIGVIPGTQKSVASLLDITERKKMEKTLQKHGKELDLLYGASQQLSQTLDLKTIYSTVYEFISDVMDCDSLFLSSYNNKDNLIRCVFALRGKKYFDPTNFPPIPLPPETKGCGTQSIAIRTGKSLLIRDYDAQAKTSKTRYYVGDDGQVIDKKPPDDIDRTRSAIIVPIKLEGEVVGVIQVFSYRYNAYTDENLKLIEGLAPIVASARNNAFLYQKSQEEIVERKNAEKRIYHLNSVLKTIRNVNQLIVLEKEKDKLLQKICDVLIEELNYTAAWLGFSEDEKKFVIVKGTGFGKNISRFSKEILAGNHPYCIKTALSGKEDILLFYDRGEECKDCFFKGPHPEEGIAIMRIEHENKLFGLLAIMLAQGMAIDEEEKELLVEVAGDIAFALNNMELEEEKEKISKNLKKKNEELERFLYTATHDLKTPLVTIHGFGELLESDLKEGNIKEAKESLKKIKKATRRMDDIIESVLKIGRLGWKKTPITNTDFNTLIKKIVNDLEIYRAKNSIEIVVSPGMPILSVEKDKIGEVFSNLITNAIEHMGTPPNPKIEIGSKKTKDAHHFYVKDNGVGIAPEYHEKIFETFEKLDNKDAGTGVGLAIVKKIVEDHDGRAWVDSALGEGATFWFSLPISDNSSIK